MAKPRRFLSVRDKNDGSRRRSESSESGQKARSVEAFLSLLKNDGSKQGAKEEQARGSPAPERQELELSSQKIEDALRRLEELGLGSSHVSPDIMRNAVLSRFAAGDVGKIAVYADLMGKATQGQLLPYKPGVEMVGAINWESVTCWLDSVLFAMFASLDAFDCMLKGDFPDEAKRKLACTLRLWVNMLRSGNLIHTDLTKTLIGLLVDNGWPEAGVLQQQDPSEAFTYITGMLELPLLRMQVDLYHDGLEEEDDHKIAHERLLDIAVPPDLDGTGVKLEDCLEEYFNTRVDVSRGSWVDRKGSVRQDSLLRMTPPASEKKTIRLVSQEEEGDPEMCQSPTSLPSSPLSRRTTSQTLDQSPGPCDSPGVVRPSPRNRSTSLIQHIMVDEKEGGSRKSAKDGKPRRTRSTIVKAVTMPAWQFFRLIPWHSSANEDPSNDQEVAMSLDRRPVVGICLKRYAVTAQGIPIRHNTHIDIPESFRLPNFVGVNNEMDESGNSQISAGYKLVLRSVVCHRGSSIHSGHYIAFARMAPKILTENRRFESDPPPDYEEAQWVRFDDMDLDSRVTHVDNILQCLKDEMPYMLFYQVMPIMDGPEPSEQAQPPSYYGSLSASSYVSVSGVDGSRLSCSPDGRTEDSDYFGRAGTQNQPGLRVSFDADLPRRSVVSTPAILRRASTAVIGSGSGSQTSQGFQAPRRLQESRGSIAPSPVITPAAANSNEERRSSRSRAANLGIAVSAFINRGRNASQGAEDRNNERNERHMFKKGKGNGLMRPSKEDIGPGRPSTSDARLERGDYADVSGDEGAGARGDKDTARQCVVM